jgi:hypothetical protein
LKESDFFNTASVVKGVLQCMDVSASSVLLILYMALRQVQDDYYFRNDHYFRMCALHHENAQCCL